MPLVVLLAFALGILRIAGVTHPAYQAVVHLYFGGVVVAAFYATIDRAKLIGISVFLFVVETACFFLKG